MSRVRIKICGVTRAGDALAAAAAGADAIGLNFWPGSKRFVRPGEARAIVAALPPLVTAVGVFVNQSEEEIRGVVEETGIQAIQLHGDEPPGLVARLSLPVLKALPADRLADAPAFRDAGVRGLVVDTPTTGHGGSGRTFDWALLAALPPGVPFLLAGGLTPENVAGAVRATRPFGVDVASGVESSPGVKDAARMSRFVLAVREGESP